MRMENQERNESLPKKIVCQICGLAFESQGQKEKHWELEHMKNKRPAGVR